MNELKEIQDKKMELLRKLTLSSTNANMYYTQIYIFKLTVEVLPRIIIQITSLDDITSDSKQHKK